MLEINSIFPTELFSKVNKSNGNRRFFLFQREFPCYEIIGFKVSGCNFQPSRMLINEMANSQICCTFVFEMDCPYMNGKLADNKYYG
ncbi:hypothetical protein Cycma_2782 [Cyclobacterium marinum DSM 745]|uniref:Uncharacterized protein n=1 Tax=Cyclobacterium marinum (strain ATCC 25205 / DSM 745 / LMG 13164 / NCIMB 1802) TaxID=880070 RepID=G0J019_CYCMS|nr:hypothetical protein Cycma_2782 [Cyclobacterium marinum DSM 745]